MPGGEVVERVVVQDIGDGITHRTHHMLHRTLGMFGIGAVPAFLIGRLAHTSDGSKGAIQNANHLAKGNLSRRLNQCVAPLHPSTTREEAGSFQCQEDLFKKFDWDMLARRDLVALQCPSAMHESELKQCTKSVLAFFRELHGQVNVIQSELIKICDNRAPRLIPSRVDLKNLSGIIHGASFPTTIHPVDITCCNLLILEGLFLDRLSGFLLVSSLAPRR